jgi:hypothetical protein
VGVPLNCRRIRDEPRIEARRLCAVETHGIGLQRAEAGRRDFRTERFHVVEVAHRRDPEPLLEDLGLNCPEVAAVRPVERDSRAVWAAEERIDRHAQRLRLEIQTSVLDGADRLMRHAAGRQPRDRMEHGAERADAQWVLADDARREAADDLRRTAGAEAVIELRPADEPFIGRQLQEGQSPPSAVGL